MAVFGYFSIKNKFWDNTKAVIVIELSPQFLTSTFDDNKVIKKIIKISAHVKGTFKTCD